jgi:hypothetical protein
MICLIWRQHRGQAAWTIVTVTALCLLLVNSGLGAEPIRMFPAPTATASAHAW